ncbi:pyridoxamine 5'-phosphate oxidase family protein [Arthrobacter sp. VKM Ac-2550]|uniref:pyridoxamine 5'-phosphate oxidase family protein n=1 Tax=Crystallibacter permensis TaxID=1938888 RepID=UPI0022277E4A|nr:pyridoxamine 5'-phosphate oxidase family protein [Arthrobacter sp. VKM Ac-2550]MCW2134426.1 Pyridoxamine 5'-phosphate oxidase [Arthrobacter sp. VKM Ac-2550]
MSEDLRMPDAGHPTLRLGPDECWELLAGTTLGRLAVSYRNEPDVIPVNFWAAEKSILLHGSEHVRDIVRRAGHYVVLEADGRSGSSVWSVMAKGTLRELTGPDEIAAAQRRQLKPWTLTRKLMYLELQPSELTGRRIAVGPEIND